MSERTGLSGRILIGFIAVTVLAGVLCPSPASAGSPGKARIVADWPSAVLPHVPLSLTGHTIGLRRGDQLKLERRVGGAWGTLVATRLRGSRFALTLLPPSGSRRIRLQLSALRGGRVVATDSAVVSVGHRVLVSVKRAGTVEAAPKGVRGIVGDPTGIETVTLAPSSQTPTVGGVLAIPVSSNAPQGLLGKVTGVRRDAAGQVVATTQPATLDQAYSRYAAGVSGTFGSLHAFVAAANTRGRNRDARISTAPRLTVGPKELTCKGVTRPPQISFDADFSKVNFDAYVDTSKPSIYFLVAGSPKIRFGLQFSGASCEYTGDLRLVIPIGGALDIELRPAFSVQAGGSIGVTWTPRIAAGFSRGSGADSDTHFFSPNSAQFAPSGELNGDVFVGGEVDLALGGRVGITAKIGPDFQPEDDPAKGPSCFNIVAPLRIDLGAFVDVFVKKWSITLVSGEFPPRVQLFSSCKPRTPKKPGNGGTNSGPASIKLTVYGVVCPPSGGSNTPCPSSGPLSGATVSVSGHTQVPYVPGSPPVYCAETALVTDSQGVVTFTNCPPGIYQFPMITKPGWHFGEFRPYFVGQVKAGRTTVATEFMVPCSTC